MLRPKSRQTSAAIQDSLLLIKKAPLDSTRVEELSIILFSHCSAGQKKLEYYHRQLRPESLTLHTDPKAEFS